MIAVLYGFFVGSGLRFIIEKTPHGKTHVTSLALIAFDIYFKKMSTYFLQAPVYNVSETSKSEYH